MHLRWAVAVKGLGKIHSGGLSALGVENAGNVRSPLSHLSHPFSHVGARQMASARTLTPLGCAFYGCLSYEQGASGSAGQGQR
jgi:hypothetical protein